MRSRLIRSALLATILAGTMAGVTAAQPDNGKTLHFELTCDDGMVWDASFNGGPVAFHLGDGQLFIWKQIDYVTPTGETGSILKGIQGFSGAPTVVCTYTGAVSGNAYTVTGFYPKG
jgi:predicted Rdx family selenoprotein